MPPRLHLAWALALAALLVGCAGPRHEPSREPAAPPSALPDSPDEVWHVVERGQTLWRIAKAYGASINALIEANQLADPTQIEVGRRLLIPGATVALEVEPAPSLVGGDTPPGVTFAPGDAPTAGIWRWPLSGGRLLSAFGAPRGSRSHQGLDLGADKGTPVVAVRDGVVVYAAAGMRGYGKTVIVDHGDGWQTLYAHNSSLLVRTGERVRAGASIARVGRTGNATGDHLHFEMRNNGRAVDPIVHLPRRAER